MIARRTIPVLIILFSSLLFSSPCFASELVESAFDRFMKKVEAAGELTDSAREQIEAFRQKVELVEDSKPTDDLSAAEMPERQDIVHRDVSLTGDAVELSVRPDDSGHLTFRFRNQSWVDVLNWCSDISEKTFSWTTLPDTRVSVGVDGPVSVNEALSVIGSCLLTEAYCLCHGEDVILASNLKDLDYATLEMSKLAELSEVPGSFLVRLTVSTGRLEATQMQFDLLKSLGSHCRVSRLLGTNKLVLAGTAGGLLDAAQVVRQSGY